MLTPSCIVIPRCVDIWCDFVGKIICRISHISSVFGVRAGHSWKVLSLGGSSQQEPTCPVFKEDFGRRVHTTAVGHRAVCAVHDREVASYKLQGQTAGFDLACQDAAPSCVREHHISADAGRRAQHYFTYLGKMWKITKSRSKSKPGEAANEAWLRLHKRPKSKIQNPKSKIQGGARKLRTATQPSKIQPLKSSKIETLAKKFGFDILDTGKFYVLESGFWILGFVPQGSSVTVAQRSEVRFVRGPRGQPFWMFFDIDFLTLLRDKKISVDKASRCFKPGDVWHFRWQAC